MFENFDFSVLDNPEFKEDSVCEEIILPIIKALGYKLDGDDRVVRSRSLLHPYVALGSKQRKVSIVPDYVFLSDSKPYWILDAKSPTESVIKSTHVEQAYSYAIHPEIRAELFGLCNGREFSLFSIKKFEPLLHFALTEIDKYWEILLKILHPEVKANPEVINYLPDYGLHLRKLGANAGFQFIGAAIKTNFVMKVEDGLYTTTTAVPAEREYALSLDFDEAKLKKLLKILPTNLAARLENGLNRQPYHVHLNEEVEEFKFGVVSEMTHEIFHNAEESYIPFEVIDFMPYMELEEE
jgi:Type I restriction enzyme R protein N terminus (HSDR_N)